MMDTAFDGQRLQAGFTFLIVETIKLIKIHPMPRATGLPWGLSLAAGIMVAVMTFGSQMVIHQSAELTVLPGETQTLKVREMAVDIMSSPGTSLMAGRQGDANDGGMDPRNPENASPLVPAMGGGTWTQRADMPTARYLTGSAVVDGKIYVIGGAPVPYGATAVVEEYDPATDTWRTRANMPTARQWEAVSAVDGIIYAIGGSEGRPAGDRDLSTVEAYDPATDMWTKKADMPTTRCPSATAVVDGIIYVIGGVFATPAGYQTGDVEILSTVEAYDPATDTWTRKADMPTARFYTGACVVDGRIYVSGGTTDWREGIDVSTVEIYDPRTDTWTKGADMPRAKLAHTASAVDGKMYIIGGENIELAGLWRDGKIREDEMGELFSIAYMYDPAVDTWTTMANLPTPRSCLTAAVVDGKIYAIGGVQDPKNPALSIVEEYDPGL